MSTRKAGPNRFEENSLSFLDSTAEVAFASDEEHRIVVWNQAAARLLGYDAAQVAGRKCHEVIRGTDLYGNRFCGDNCPVRQMDRRSEPIHAFQIEVPNASGEMLRVACNIIVIPGPRLGGHSLIHLLVPVAREAENPNARHTPRVCIMTDADPDPSPENKPSSDCPRALTSREAQILRLVAGGTDTPQIAALLGISIVTVRNHIQHILYKLEVHNKLHAIFVARRFNLI